MVHRLAVCLHEVRPERFASTVHGASPESVDFFIQTLICMACWSEMSCPLLLRRMILTSHENWSLLEEDEVRSKAKSKSEKKAGLRLCCLGSKAEAVRT